MSRFAFTGPAVVNGTHFERKYLIALAKEKGHEVQNKVDNQTDFLVCDPLKNPSTATLTKKFKNYANTSNTHTVRITSEKFLQKMGFL